MKKLILFLLWASLACAQTVNTARMLSGVNYVPVGLPFTFSPIDTTRVTVFTSSTDSFPGMPAGSNQFFGTGSIFTVINLGSGTVNIACLSCTINGQSVFQLTQNQGADIYGDGVNFVASIGAGSGGGGGGGGAFSAITSGTNNIASMFVGNGASLAPTGTGFIRANAFSPLTTAITAPGIVSETHCASLGLNAYAWTPLSDGTYAEQKCIDTVTATVSPQNVDLIARKTFFNDSMAGGQPGKNAFVSLDHTLGVGTDPTIQDRAWWMLVQTPAGDSGTRKSMAGLQIEMDYNGTVVFSPGPDSEASALSLQVADFHTTNLTSPALGTNAIRASYFRESGAGWYNSPQAVFNGQFDNLSNVAGNSQAMAIFTAKWSDDQNLTTAIPVIGFYNRGFTNRFSANIGFDSINMGTSTNDYDLVMEGVNSAGAAAGFSAFVGPVALGQQIHAAAGFQFDVLGKVKIKQSASASPALTLFGITGGSAGLGVADNAGSPNTLNLPTATGANGQCLVTDGGNPQQLSWSSTCIGGGGGTGIQSWQGDSASIQTATVVNDTNFTGAYSVVSPLHTLTLGFTGTLAAGRLNSNVVQAVTPDTNISGSISGQNLTFSWIGTLAATRLNANVVQGFTNDTNVCASILSQNATLGWQGSGGCNSGTPVPLSVARGGTNLGAFLANQLLVGTAANVFTAATLPNGVVQYNTTTHLFSAASVATNPMTTLGDMIYGGALGVPTALSGPIGPDGVAYNLCSASVSGVATAPVWCLGGVGGRTVSGTTDTIVATDRTAWEIYTSNGSSVAVTIAAPGTTGFTSNFVTRIIVQGTSPVTVTPGGGATIDGGASKTFNQGENCQITSLDNTNYSTSCSPGQLIAGTGIGFARTATGITISAAATGTPSNVTNRSTSQTAVTIGTAPTSGVYTIKYYANLNTACSTGGNSVNFTFNWTDAGASRSLTTGNLSLATGTPAASSYMTGLFTIFVGSGNVTYTSTISGACATGTSSYDVHVALAP